VFRFGSPFHVPDSRFLFDVRFRFDRCARAIPERRTRHADLNMNTNPEPSTQKSERFRAYSPLRRTALVLGGAGADGAYQGGVLRALHEAGVKIDLLAGHGVGAATAALAAIDGAARLWEADGLWQAEHAARLYGWTRSLRLVLGLTAAALVALFALALPVIATAVMPGIGVAFGPAVAVTLLVVLLAAVGGAVWIAHRSLPALRRAHGPWWWRIAGAPLDATAARDRVADVLWQLIRGAAPEGRPSSAALGRRYAEVLRENLGQPGFRELLLVATDLDARQDVVAALLGDRWRADFAAPRPGRPRTTDLLDLSGAGRDHAFDMVAAGMTPPVGCDPAMVTFAADSRWRGETHRLCDRPGALHRLLEEAAAAGATQVIVVSAVAAADEPHRLRVPHLDPRRRLGEFQAAAEAAALRDALDVARLRFDAAYLISPTHNPVGSYDLSGAYDEASDRRQDLHELMQRAYEDAYRQFVEPVIGASGEHLGRAEAHGAPADAHAGTLFHDLGSTRIRDLD
jgi:hypothetical protein